MSTVIAARTIASIDSHASPGAPGEGPLVLDEGDAAAGRKGLWRALVALLAARLAGPYEAAVAERKRALLGALSGRVLEIGPGAGANLTYFGRGVEWIGVEPSLPMQSHLRRRAGALGVRGRLVTGTAERLPQEESSVDAVVSTLVLCSVSDVARALAEIRRVLRPGGRFVFIEHVAAPAGTPLRRAQRRWRPVWRLVGDGCRPDQETARSIERAGFASLRVEPFDAGAGLLSPHLAGVAVR